MHQTELASNNYCFGRINSVEIFSDMGPILDHFYTYQSRFGALSYEGKPIYIAGMTAKGRSWSAMSQEQI